MRPWIRALAVTLALGGSAYAGEAAKAPPAKADVVVESKAPSTKAEVAKADENRKKPLQRCDELKGDPQLACLKKARERIVQERAKRESKGEKK